MQNNQKKFSLKSDVVFQPMDDDPIIVSLGSEDNYKLNLTGTRVVKLIEEQHPLPITHLPMKFTDFRNHLNNQIILLAVLIDISIF